MIRLSARDRATLRRVQRRYKKDLTARTRRVPCPACGARKGQPCRGARGPCAGHHVDRKDAAKIAGHVCGRRKRVHATPRQRSRS